MLTRRHHSGIRLTSLILVIALGCGGDPVGPSVGPPATISFVGGSTQTGTVGVATPTPPAAKVTDASGTGVAGVQVVFDVLAGGGTISGDSAITNAQGIATVGSWQLGPALGVQTLRVQAVGKPLLATLNVAATAGPPASIQVVEGASGLSAIVSQPVLTTPVVRIRDMFGNPIANATVSWTVLSGGGAIVGPSTTTTDASGRTTVQGWVLGSTAGSNSLQARTTTGITAVITATSIGIPAGMAPASSTSQVGVSSFLVERTARVRVFDTQNQPVAGVPVVFTLTSPPGTGAIAGAHATTDASGIASLGDWRIGATGISTVRAEVVGVPSQAVTFEATGTPRGFTIDLRFLSIPPANIRDAFVEAALRWMEVITGDLPDRFVSLQAQSCVLDNAPAFSETVDDIVIFADFPSIDGPGNILGQANFCDVRPGSRLPSAGGMQFDIADALALELTGRFKDVAIHEMGHVLGLSKFNWGPLGLVTGLGGTDPFYTGTAGTAGWSTLNIPYAGQPVPVENEHGEGTRDSHWRESVLNTEIMTGFIEAEGIPMPLTRLTIGALQDAGYQVDLSKADVYVATLRGALLNFGPKERLGETIVPPGHVVDRDGKVRPLN
ncbi:MAG TPA: Ig-like domain-containing protein [Gemmatimonadales bacterium]|nr:Ig-like domain-containing protein [Gemmatimonadales bacterium]